MKLMRSAATMAAGLLALTSALTAQKPAPKPAAPTAPAPVIVLDTVKGTIEFETFPDEAPKTVAHIVELVKKNFYNGMRFHRAEENFLVQVGDPQSRDMSREAWWGRGPGSGKPIGVAEISKRRKHVPGHGRRWRTRAIPKFADTQFYIVMQPRPGLDGKFTIFGRVTSGMDVVKKLKRADILKKASVK